MSNFLKDIGIWTLVVVTSPLWGVFYAYEWMRGDGYFIGEGETWL